MSARWARSSARPTRRRRSQATLPAFARFGWRERGPGAADIGHDLAVYAIAGFSLVFFAIGIGDAIHHLVMALQGTREVYSPLDVTNVTWTVWGGIAAWFIAG